MRTLTVAATAALALMITGCTSAPQPPSELTQPTEAPPPAASGEIPCGVVTDADLAEIVGQNVGAGRERTASTVTEQGVTWHPRTCVWDGDDLEVELSFSDAAAFESGTLTCREPLGIWGDVQPVGGIGDQAWWESDDEDEGLLRACTQTHVIDVEIDGDDLDARTASITLMERALAAVE